MTDGKEGNNVPPGFYYGYEGGPSATAPVAGVNPSGGGYGHYAREQYPPPMYGYPSQAPPPVYAPQYNTGGQTGGGDPYKKYDHGKTQPSTKVEDPGLVVIDMGDGPRDNQPPEAETGIQPKGVRNQFLVKVYSLVFLQIGFTAGFSCMCVFVIPVRDFFGSTPWIWIPFFVGTFICLFVLQAVRHKHPLNLIMLAVFTLFMSTVVGSACATYAQNGYGTAIAWAFVSTTVIFLVITVYCYFSKKDFSFLLGFIAAGFVALLMAFIVVFFLQIFIGPLSRWTWFGINLAGSLLVTAVLLYDSSQIVNKYPVDEYIQGTIALYVDFIQLFLCILNVAGAAGG